MDHRATFTEAMPMTLILTSGLLPGKVATIMLGILGTNTSPPCISSRSNNEPQLLNEIETRIRASVMVTTPSSLAHETGTTLTANYVTYRRRRSGFASA
jgi:hypothetical protein